MKRVFVSFDFDNDARLKDLFAGQAKLLGSPFQLADWSLKEAAPEASWETKAEARIVRCDVVVVLVGKHTYRAPGVKKEIGMARRNNISIIQVTNLEKATKVEGAGRLYKWTWDNMKNLLN